MLAMIKPAPQAGRHEGRNSRRNCQVPEPRRFVSGCSPASGLRTWSQGTLHVGRCCPVTEMPGTGLFCPFL